MNIFTNAYNINSCYWRAGQVYKWSPELGMVGIGIAEKVLKQQSEKFMIKAYGEYYEVSKLQLREHFRKYKQNIYIAKRTKILVIPRDILFRWGRDEVV